MLNRFFTSGRAQYFWRTADCVIRGDHPMTRPAPARYSELDARARFDQALNDALSAPRKLLTLTATMKRRALKKKLEKPKKTPEKTPEKKAGKGGAIPAVLFSLQRDPGDRGDS